MTHKCCKTFGALRRCTGPAEWHGFGIRPGMYFGQDQYGYYATYGEKKAGRYIVFRASRKTEQWYKRLEDRQSDLTAQLDALSDADRGAQQALRQAFDEKAAKRQTQQSRTAAGKKRKLEAKKARQAKERRDKREKTDMAKVTKSVRLRLSAEPILKVHRISKVSYDVIYSV